MLAIQCVEVWHPVLAVIHVDRDPVELSNPGHSFSACALWMDLTVERERRADADRRLRLRDRRDHPRQRRDEGGDGEDLPGVAQGR